MAEQLLGSEEQECINALAQSVLLHPYAVQQLMSRCAQEQNEWHLHLCSWRPLADSMPHLRGHNWPCPATGMVYLCI